MNMFLFPLGLRKSRLERALREYPLYDPPHRVEERLLSKEKAAENFDYFMRVRLDRVTHFRDWLREEFRFKISLDEKGMRALCLWASRYAGFLLAKDADGYPTNSYFTYDPPWAGENIGCNVVFDFGIVVGQAILANCPKLRWDFDPISAILPQTVKILKETSGMSFWRPIISGFENPAYRVPVLHKAYEFSFSMTSHTTSVAGMKQFRRLHRFDQRLIFEAPVNLYLETLKNYPKGDPAGLLREMGKEQYLKLVDDEVNVEDPDE